MSNGSQGGEGKTQEAKLRFRWPLYTFLFLFGIGGLAWGANYVWTAYQALPAYEDFDPSLTSMIYDSKGNKVYELADDQHWTLITLKDVPEAARFP